MARIGNFWCKLMHDEPMWPMHGWYECRTCGRQHRAWRNERAKPEARSLRQRDRRANVSSPRQATSAANSLADNLPNIIFGTNIIARKGVKS
jgi:hypothetical protein